MTNQELRELAVAAVDAQVRFEASEQAVVDANAARNAAREKATAEASKLRQALNGRTLKVRDSLVWVRNDAVFVSPIVDVTDLDPPKPPPPESPVSPVVTETVVLAVATGKPPEPPKANPVKGKKGKANNESGEVAGG